MQDDAWIFTDDGSYFDMEKGFSHEWSAMAATFAIVDLETSGTDPKTCKITEFAAIRVAPSGQILEKFSALVADVPNARPALASTDVNPSEESQMVLPLAEALSAFQSFIGNLPVFIHHAAFDLAFLDAEAKRCGGFFQNEVFETMDIFFMTWPNLPHLTVERLAAHLNMSPPPCRPLDYLLIINRALVLVRELARSDIDYIRFGEAL